MATFKARVEQLSGTTPSDDVLSDWLTAGARTLANLIPETELDRYISLVSVSETGTTITDGIIYGVTKEGYPARKVNVAQSYGLQRRDSLYYPSEKTPVYTLIGKNMKVFPDGGQAWMLPLYVVLHSQTTIANFPNDLEHGVVLFAAMANKSYQMQNYLSQISITYNDALSASIGVTTIDNLPSPLTYGPVTAPTLLTFSGTIPTAPTFTDITIPQGVTPPGELTAVTGILFTAATAIGVSAENIGAFPQAPTFTKVATPPTYTDFTTQAGEDDVEMAQLYLAKIDREQQDWQAKVNEELQEFNAEFQVFKNNTDKLIEQARVNLQQKIADGNSKDSVEQFNKLKAFESTVEEYSAQIRRYQAIVERYVQIVNTEIQLKVANIQAKTQIYTAQISAYVAEVNTVNDTNQVLIAKFNADMQNAMNKFQVDLVAYQATVQKNLEQAQLSQQRLLSQAASDTDVSKTNKASHLQALVQEYQTKLGRLQNMQVEMVSLMNQYRDVTDKYMFKKYGITGQQAQ
jgi:hypothetical protein